MADDEGKRGRLTRFIPALHWIPNYDRRLLRGDLVAGIAVAALVVQKNLGYADIAHVPLQNGLYAAAGGGIIYALFCTSRHISTGPSSSLAAVAGGAAVLGAGLLRASEHAAELVAFDRRRPRPRECSPRDSHLAHRTETARNDRWQLSAGAAQRSP